ncbi:MAG: HAMP domain-containing sensor histidine kinase [Thermodesulfobacteriota bacterium]
MKRLIIFIVLFCLLLTLPLGYFVLRTYHGLAQEEEGALRYFAESLFARMEEDLAQMVAQEEARGVFEYAASGSAAAPADNGAARFPFVVGYLQNGPEGAMDLPPQLNTLLEKPGGMDRQRLSAANTAFNRKRSLEVEIATARAEAAPPPQVLAKAKAQAPSIAEQYVKQAPLKEKTDTLGKQANRYEEITVGQARELASAGRKSTGDPWLSSLFRRGSEKAAKKDEWLDSGSTLASSSEKGDVSPPAPEKVQKQADARQLLAFSQEKPAPVQELAAPRAPAVMAQEAESLPAAAPAPEAEMSAPEMAAPAEPENLVAGAPLANEAAAEMPSVSGGRPLSDQADADRQAPAPSPAFAAAAESAEPADTQELAQVMDLGPPPAAPKPEPARSREDKNLQAALRALPEGTGRFKKESEQVSGKPRPNMHGETRKVFVEVAPLQSLFLSADTVFVFRRIMVGNETFRQGFVVDVPALLAYFCRDLFEGQPMAGFAGLSLSAEDAGREVSRCNAGHGAKGHAFLLSRSFPRPFSFLAGTIACDQIPATRSRSRLNIMIAILALVLCAGFFALFWSARAAWEYSERRSAFVSSVTHELKTPLTNIRLYIEMLESGMAVDREREEEYLRILSSESGRLSRLIENVLEFSRLERKRRVMSLATGDLSEVLAAVRDAHGPRLENEGFRFRIRKDGIEPFAYDREAMVQVISNLVDNARKFSGASPEKEIEISVIQDENETRIAVSDRGPGIPRKALSKIFQDFYRVENAPGPLVGGTGIGLALTRKLVAAMGGKVTAKNNDGPGLTVTIRLPRKSKLS